jgi:hypothetical protein
VYRLLYIPAAGMAAVLFGGAAVLRGVDRLRDALGARAY